MNPDQTQPTPETSTQTPVAAEQPAAAQTVAPNGMVTPTGGTVTPPVDGSGAPVLAPVAPAQPQFAAAAPAGNEPSGWNWGAFWLSWIWGIGNRVWWSLLAFIPFVNIVMPFVLGAKGTKAAWEASENKDINTFKAHQHTWAVVGWVWAGISILIVIPILFLMVIGSYNGIQQAAKDAQNQSNSNYSNSSFSQ